MPSNSEPESQYVSLVGGLTVPVDAYRLLFDLVDRGLLLTQDGEALRVKGPNGAKPDLSADEIARVKKWKLHLLALLAYRAPEPAALFAEPFEMP